MVDRVLRLARILRMDTTITGSTIHIPLRNSRIHVGIGVSLTRVLYFEHLLKIEKTKIVIIIFRFSKNLL